MRHDPTGSALVRRMIEGRVYAALAQCKRPPTLDDLARDGHLHGIDREQVAQALAQLVTRGLVAAESHPAGSTTTPLFESAALHYRTVALAALTGEGR